MLNQGDFMWEFVGLIGVCFSVFELFLEGSSEMVKRKSASDDLFGRGEGTVFWTLCYVSRRN